MDNTLVETLGRIQNEQVRWVLHNFGARTPTQPLLGMFEELSEFQEVVGKDTVEEIDAICDLTIFGLDYLSALGLPVDQVFTDEVLPMIETQGQTNLVWSVSYTLGKVAHHQLKMHQGIRIGEDHMGMIKVYMRATFNYLDNFMTTKHGRYVDHLNATWHKVSQRNWVNNKENGNG